MQIFFGMSITERFMVFDSQLRDQPVADRSLGALGLQEGIVDGTADVDYHVVCVFLIEVVISHLLALNTGIDGSVDLHIFLVIFARISRVMGIKQIFEYADLTRVADIRIIRLNAYEIGYEIRLVLAGKAPLMRQLVSGSEGNCIIGEDYIYIRLAGEKCVYARDVGVGHRFARHYELHVLVELRYEVIFVGCAAVCDVQ